MNEQVELIKRQFGNAAVWVLRRGAKTAKNGAVLDEHRTIFRFCQFRLIKAIQKSSDSQFSSPLKPSQIT